MKEYSHKTEAGCYLIVSEAVTFVLDLRDNRDKKIDADDDGWIEIETTN